MEYDAIVVGAGIWGCTIARRLADKGRKVRIYERRDGIGGNCRCEIDDKTGIEIHLYGSHIFHTSNEDVWKFVNRFTAFNSYRHCVLANYKGRIYHLPIGKTLYREFFGDGTIDNKAIFDAFIRGYTSKQWGVPPEDVDPSVIARLKVRDNFSTDYFDDPHQGIPSDGYNKMFERMLDHPGIEVVHSEFRLVSGQKSIGCPTYYSGPIDKLFDYRFGPLPWRTLKFEAELLPTRDFQHNSVVNYTEVEVPYTRIHEFKHYHPEWADSANTIIMREYPGAWKIGDEPYYPVDNATSRELYAKYSAEADKVENLIVGGRLGGYKYYDMDKAIEAALEIHL